ncbi:B3 domain-containing protein Os01g0723500-like [Ananas comosus]|uniref:B3 domain-containing protein Os01g0723500-like n=1 Tax=Ananas comosus TaxID=4615 RepID=A0A6P5FXS1_ANACO|nr:B3 domain-containing protein Os01g0723500-like [Ananas comosus]
MTAKKHRAKCSSETRKPHFFKVLLGDFAQRLKIPPNFLKHISTEASRTTNNSKEASKTAILEGPSGSKWHVELGKTAKGTFLTNGWPKFVKDHSMKEYEFLVFRYDGSMHFTVIVFDKTACEREDLFSVRAGRPQKLSSDIHYSVVKNEASESELTELPSSENRTLNRLQVVCSDSVQTKAREGDELPICAIPTPPKRCQYMSRRRPVADEERLKAQEAAASFKSTFPYFIIRMCPMHVYWSYMLRFPVRFSREHLPRNRVDMVLRDPSGAAWKVVYIPSTRDRLSGGWGAFARGNCLEEGDYCAFELIEPLEFRVHVFRVVEETQPPLRLSKNLGGLDV